MDLAARSFSDHHAGGREATVSIDSMHFLRPVAIGDEVSCYCALLETGETSIKVKIDTWARTRGEPGATKVTEGVFTFVAVDENGQKRAVPKGGD